jgi:hypothetical protein
MTECECGNLIHPERVKLGYDVCLECGEKRAIEDRSHWTVVPMHKSNYVLVTDASLLKGLNKSMQS